MGKIPQELKDIIEDYYEIDKKMNKKKFNKVIDELNIFYIICQAYFIRQLEHE